jgi:hypothetical protein
MARNSAPAMIAIKITTSNAPTKREPEPRSVGDGR